MIQRALPLLGLAGCISYGTVADEIRTECVADADAVSEELRAAEARMTALEEELAWVRQGRAAALGELAELEELLSIDDSVSLDADLVVDGSLVSGDASVGVGQASVVFTGETVWASEDAGTPLFTGESNSSWLVTLNEVTRSGAAVDVAAVWIVSVSNFGTCHAEQIAGLDDVRIFCSPSTLDVVAETNSARTAGRFQWLRLQ